MRLAGLSRIEIPDGEAETLVNDLERILEHFDELKSVKTDSISPFFDATHEKNVTRDDVSDKTHLTGEHSVEGFPVCKGRFLKIPPVFE